MDLVLKMIKNTSYLKTEVDNLESFANKTTLENLINSEKLKSKNLSQIFQNKLDELESIFHKSMMSLFSEFKMLRFKNGLNYIYSKL